MKAEKILDASHRRAARLGEEIREMRGVRTLLALVWRTSIDTHLVVGQSTDSQEVLTQLKYPIDSDQ